MFLISSLLSKYQRTLVKILRIEILRHRKSSTQISTDAKLNSRNSRVEVGGGRDFKGREIGIVSA